VGDTRLCPINAGGGLIVDELGLDVERPKLADSVEKLSVRRLLINGRKNDLLDRATNRSRTSVRGKATPQNLARSLVQEFFNRIGRVPPHAAKAWSTSCAMLRGSARDPEGTLPET
jgi:hypothetical protein